MTFMFHVPSACPLFSYLFSPSVAKTLPERRHTVRDAIGNAQFDPIEGPHIMAQEDAVAVVDYGQDRPDKQGDLD